MFDNLGRTLALLRELRGRSQAWVAREAGVGKSQLSKYENGKELPKLDSLEKVLTVLDVGHFEFFYTLYLVDRRAADLSRESGKPRASRAPAGDEAAMDDEPAYLPPVFKGHPVLSEPTDQAFTRVFADLLLLYRRVFEQIVLSGIDLPDDFKAKS
jgi:transcriptional regulator with XRE-family HTH domain